jgi:hypothetical protein
MIPPLKLIADQRCADKLFNTARLHAIDKNFFENFSLRGLSSQAAPASRPYKLP